MSAVEYRELDLNKVVERWSTDKLDTFHPDLKGKKLLHKCDFSKVKFIDLPPTYENVPGKVKSQILFEAKYRNDTDREQKFLFKANKNTSSISKITLNNALIKDGKTRLFMSKLPSEIESAPGFNDQFAVKDFGGEMYEENLEWGVDTYVTVDSESSLQATLTVDEMSYAAQFNVITAVSGLVHVNVVDPVSGSHITAYTDYILSVIRDYCGSSPFDPSIHISRSVKGNCFVTEGFCQFRIGLTHNVNLSTQ